MGCWLDFLWVSMNETLWSVSSKTSQCCYSLKYFSWLKFGRKSLGYKIVFHTIIIIQRFRMTSLLHSCVLNTTCFKHPLYRRKMFKNLWIFSHVNTILGLCLHVKYALVKTPCFRVITKLNSGRNCSSNSILVNWTVCKIRMW